MIGMVLAIMIGSLDAAAAVRQNKGTPARADNSRPLRLAQYSFDFELHLTAVLDFRSDLDGLLHPCCSSALLPDRSSMRAADVDCKFDSCTNR